MTVDQQKKMPEPGYDPDLPITTLNSPVLICCSKS